MSFRFKGPTIVDYLVGGTAGAIVGGIIGRAIREIGEATHAFNPGLGGIVGVLIALAIVYLIEHAHD